MNVSANNVRKIREALMMSKAELARKAGLSTLTIDRVEAGRRCRLDTKRKILQALGFKIADKQVVFGPDLPMNPAIPTDMRRLPQN
jgi:predicted transcriptional regulator